MKAGWRIHRLANGSRLVARRTHRAFIPLDDDGEIRLLAAALRCGPAIAAAPRLLDLAHQSPIWLVGGTSAWCIAAWRARPEKPADAKSPTASQEDLRQAVVDRLLGWMEERPAIHFSEVYERYRQTPGHGHLTDDQIRAALVDHYGIPWRRSVADSRKTEQRTRAGIRRVDLQALPSPEAAAPVAEARNTVATSDVAA